MLALHVALLCAALVEVQQQQAVLLLPAQRSLSSHLAVQVLPYTHGCHPPEPGRCT